MRTRGGLSKSGVGRLLQGSACLLLLCLLASAAGAAELVVSWDPNTEDDLAGYKLYYGTASGDYGEPIVLDAAELVPVGGKLYYLLENLEPATTYYVALTAYDSSGNESALSEEASYTTAADEAPHASGVTDSSGGGGGGCFIATAAWGSYAERHVRLLREFRDTVLLASAAGRAFVRAYYRLSPALAGYISGRGWLRSAVRVSLYPLLGLSLCLKLWLARRVLVFLGAAALAFIMGRLVPRRSGLSA